MEAEAFLMIRLTTSLLLAFVLSACVTTADLGGGSQADSGKGKGPRNIVGTWEVSRADSIITCKMEVKEGRDRNSGSARASGCLNMANITFVDRWAFKDGRIEFYAFVSELVMVARRIDRDEFSARLQRNDLKLRLLRK